MSENSLQINIDSIEDAKSVIANLPKVKAAYDAAGCTSVEFCIQESLVGETTAFLLGAIPWCKTFRKMVKPYDGNTLFPIPHYIAPVKTKPTPAPPVPPAPPAPVVAATPAQKSMAVPHGRVIRSPIKPLGKSAPPVPVPAREAI